VARRLAIGVTGPDRGGLTAWLMSAFALLRCGARPVRIRCGRQQDIPVLDGLVIGGGTDVDPFHYGQQSQGDADEEKSSQSLLNLLVGLSLGLLRAVFAAHSRQGYDTARDRMETALIRDALARGIPVLGICRGAQLMNVVLGGSLHQDIGQFYVEETGNIRSVLPRKSIRVAPGSCLHRILDTRRCRVNALHRQSVDRLGDGIEISAQEANGVIQAIEKRDHPFFLGVQWHPEYMPQNGTQQRLFRGLVDCAARRARPGESA
jgi:putative glutamine amidotransferase